MEPSVSGFDDNKEELSSKGLEVGNESVSDVEDKLRQAMSAATQHCPCTQGYMCSTRGNTKSFCRSQQKAAVLPAWKAPVAGVCRCPTLCHVHCATWDTEETQMQMEIVCVCVCMGGKKLRRHHCQCQAKDTHFHGATMSTMLSTRAHVFTHPAHQGL